MSFLLRKNRHAAQTGNIYLPFHEVVLFALIEFVMGKESYKPLPNFLEEKLRVANSSDKNSVQSRLNEWRIQYGSVNNVQRFFEENLRDFKKDLLDYVGQCEGWGNCDTIPKFAKQLAEFRHDFVHSLSTEQIWPWDKRFLTVENGVLKSLANPIRVPLNTLRNQDCPNRCS